MMQTILIVEDEQPIVRMLTALLKEEGYLVVEAANGQDALALLHDIRPDVIISDIMMPVMDGVELCQRLNADPALGTIPLLMMSSTSGLLRLDGCSYTAFVRKPFVLDELLQTIGKAIDGS